jgi:phage-related protein
MVNANMANVFVILVLKAKVARRKVYALKIAPNMVSAGKANVNVTQGGVVRHVMNSLTKRSAQTVALVKMVSVTMDGVYVPHSILDQGVSMRRSAQMTAVDMVNVT